jgi:gamma-glutamyltranspeptidase/glutathione hydrolase
MMSLGGNAVDAALAAAIALTVVEPTGNGLGGDAFAILSDSEGLHGLNGSGRAPQGWSPERFKSAGRMPRTGWDAVTVPGQVAAWVSLSKRFGNLPFKDLFEPAIHYARDGFPVSPGIARLWSRAPALFSEFPAFCKTFLPQGRPPEPGETFRCIDLASTLERIAESKGRDFYEGDLACAMADEARRGGGALTLADLAGHRSTWVKPLSQSYEDVTLHEIPPNGQGIAALMALGMLGELDPGQYPVDSAPSLHLQIECMKLAFADTYAQVADPDAMTVEPERLLDPLYLKARAKTISREKAAAPLTGIRPDGGTVYLTAADSDGRMISYIQSNFYGFGSGIVIPGTGISMQSRGLGFSLEPDHPNRVQGGKRPFHTIIPGFVTREGNPLMSFGVMGGNMQPQGHLQMMTRIFTYRQNPQAAADAPRWFLFDDFRLALEPGFPQKTIDDLKTLGHRIEGDAAGASFGGAQLIYQNGNTYVAASDPRRDGQAVAF